MEQNKQSGKNLWLLPIYVTTAGIHNLQKRKDRPHGAKFHQILFIEKGSGIFETPGEKIEISAPTAIFIKKNCPAAYYGTSADFTTAWVTFNGDGVDSLIEYFHAEIFSYCENSTIYPKIFSCFNLFKKFSSAEMLSRAAYDIVISYFSELNAARCPEAVTKAKGFIDENYGRDISVSDIAHAAGISPSLLYRLFKEKENATPSETLKNVRIGKAKILLLSEPGYSVAEIGRLCGFSDTAYFCKVFKAETGMSPNSFRKA